MTTETIDIQALRDAVAAAEAALAKANEDVAPKVAEIMAVTPVDFVALATASAPAGAAQSALERARKALETGIAADRWESSIDVRQPIIDALREMLIDNPIEAAMTGVRGSITIEDGKPVVSLRPVFDTPSLDSVSEAIASVVDVAKLAELEIKGLDVNITDAEKESATISLAIAGSKTPKAPKEGGATGARSGKLEYIYEGKAMSSKEFLTRVEELNLPVVADHAQSFQTTLHGSGDGMSNLAKTIAKKLNVTSRTKVE